MCQEGSCAERVDVESSVGILEGNSKHLLDDFEGKAAREEGGGHGGRHGERT